MANLHWQVYWLIGKRKNGMMKRGDILLLRRIGITTVLSTDHVRSLLRSFDPKKKSAILWASSYHAGVSSDNNSTEEAVVDGYEAQSQLLFDSLDQMITGFRQRKESLVIEVNNRLILVLGSTNNLTGTCGTGCRIISGQH